ncbi:MAG TPA: NfeD family protein [Casimicrobiaceae bacterium]|nr:NfeD family protein [Casimicrobiaceae bacterium]
METYWTWWVLAAALVGTELFTGTFYLLALGVAFALGGLAAWLGADVSSQMLIAAAFAVAGTILAHQWRRLHALPPPQAGLDVGQEVQVLAWNDNGTARVNYRGTQWDAELAAPATARGQTMYIVDTRGSTLILAADKP